MPFIKDILKHKSLSIIGMEKNTGKTECLNYIIKRLEEEGKHPALTSIGIDGESLDQVTNTHKPEIELCPDSVFVTSETHFNSKKLDAEILYVSERRTSLGRLIIARAKSKGKVIFSGPPDTVWLKEIINQLEAFKVDIILIDGALSRKSLGSPSITDSMILSTGAALSANINSLVKQTVYTHSLIQLPVYESNLTNDLLKKNQGVFALADDEVVDLGIQSAFLLENKTDRLLKAGNTLFVSGVLNDKLVELLRAQKNVNEIEIVVKDFSRIFVKQQVLNSFLKKGGSIKVLLKTNLMAICVNPVAPNGFVLDSLKLRKMISEKTSLPVYDIRMIDEE